MNVSSRLRLNEEIDGDLPFNKVNGWGLLITTTYYYCYREIINKLRPNVQMKTIAKMNFSN